MAKQVTILTLILAFAMGGLMFASADKVDNSLYWGDDIRQAYLMDSSPGPKPTTWLRTNKVVYIIGQEISVTLDMEPNGHTFDKTFFVYLQNLQTGEIRYINVNDGLLDPGVITDYNGDDLDNLSAYPVPDIQDWVIFGDNGQAGGAIATTAGLQGNHQFVIELRDVTGQRVFQRANAYFVIVTAVDSLPANITADTTLTPDKAYLLNNQTTFVKEGATLTIKAGTFILGTGQFAALAVERGGKIEAVGTAFRPIVMTSAQDVGNRAKEDWGGLVICGNGPINVPGGEGISEGVDIPYGGGTNPDPEDSSGSLIYVRVEYAGIEFSPDNELNGIAFQGTGSGTKVEYVQVHFNKDDGVEFFGGTTNAKYVLLTGNADDSMDWTEGWSGKVQFVVAQQNSDDADQGFECDNNSKNNDLEPRANPQIYNVTLIGGNAAPDSQEESDTGILLREGTAGTIRNAIVVGFGREGLEINHDSTVSQANSGDLLVTNSMFFMNSTRASGANFKTGDDVTVSFDIDAFMTAEEKMNREDIDPAIRDPFNFVSPDYRPDPTSPALNINYVATPPPGDDFFSPVHYLGGVDPGSDWTVGWTTHAPN